MSYGPTDHDLVGIFKRESIIRIVKYYLNKCIYGRRSRPLMKESLAFFLCVLGVCVLEGRVMDEDNDG
jgi:hypothetical protein